MLTIDQKVDWFDDLYKAANELIAQLEIWEHNLKDDTVHDRNILSNILDKIWKDMK